MPPSAKLPFSDDALTELSRIAAKRAWSQGMTVRKPDGTVVPIPLIAEPDVHTRVSLEALADSAQAILSGSVKLARTLLESGDALDRAALVEPFQGLEGEAVAKLFTQAPCPAVLARVDFFVPDDGSAPKALELNATIPAMQAYADLATHCWIEAAAAARGMTPRQGRELVARQGSHMEELRETLVAFYGSRGGTQARPSIALVARPGDAQIGEQRRLADHFRQMGHAAETLLPTECDPERFDILYRHVWAHRVERDAPFAQALLAPGRFVLANPVNGFLEAKALFARLSECAENSALADRAGLDTREREVAAALPWTRRLTDALVPRLLADRERYVVKRSWDYGGKSVTLGAESTPERWEAAVRSAAADTNAGGFVVQARVFSARRPATRIADDGVSRADFYRDISTFAGLGPVAPRGSVVRAAGHPIVNILGGGGLAPVIADDVLQELS